MVALASTDTASPEDFPSTVSENQTGQTSPSAGSTYPIPIDEILTHVRLHLDEIVGIYLLRGYGEAFFPGISQCGIRFVESDLIGTDEQFDHEKKLPIGCGGTETSHCRFNEHVSEYERLPGACATSLIADYLTIVDMPCLQRLLQEVLRCDTERGSTSTMLAELVKTDHRRNDGLSSDVINWVFVAISAIISQETYHYAKVQGEATLIQFFNLWLEKQNGIAAQIANRLGRLMSNSMDRMDERVTELSYIVAALSRNGTTNEQISEWLSFAFEAMLADQIAFAAELERVKKLTPISAKKDLGRSRETTLRIMVVSGSTMYSQKAARYLRNDLILCIDRSGNFQIHCNDAVTEMDLDNIVRMIRYLIMAKRGKSITARNMWNRLAQPGQYPDVKGLYYFMRGKTVLNGSLTHTAPVLPISKLELIEILRHAFYPTLRKKWAMRQVSTFDRPRSR